MKPFDYQKEALRTWDDSLSLEDGLANIGLGLCGESAEVVTEMRHLDRGSFDAIEDLERELGDVFWYVAIGCHVLGIGFGGVLKVSRRHNLEVSTGETLMRSACAFADVAKKVAFHGAYLDPMRGQEPACLRLKEIAGHAAALAEHYELPLSEIFAANSLKLRARWPEGFIKIH